MWYGSSVFRHGKSRPLRRYHSSSRRRNFCRSAGPGREPWTEPFEPLEPLEPFEPRIIPKSVKIYTKTGDSGETGLFGGVRVSKADPRVATYGDVDELNAWLGFTRASLSGLDPGPSPLGPMLEQIQKDLFAIGARLADPAHKIANRVTKAAVSQDDITRLEHWIDSLEGELPPLRRFILAGGSPAGAALHVARTTCRRAERAMVALLAGEDAAFESELLVYVNRLSDLLFVMARTANHRAGSPEIEW